MTQSSYNTLVHNQKFLELINSFLAPHSEELFLEKIQTTVKRFMPWEVFETYLAQDAFLPNSQTNLRHFFEKLHPEYLNPPNHDQFAPILTDEFFCNLKNIHEIRTYLKGYPFSWTAFLKNLLHHILIRQDQELLRWYLAILDCYKLNDCFESAQEPCVMAAMYPFLPKQQRQKATIKHPNLLFSTKDLSQQLATINHKLLNIKKENVATAWKTAKVAKQEET